MIESLAAIVLLMAVAHGALGLALVVRRSLQQRESDALALDTLRVDLKRARTHLTTRERESDSWAGWRKFRVAQKVNEGGDITSFYLEPHDAKPIPAYQPGQYLTFSLRVPGQPAPVVRCYSLSDAPQDSHYRISVKRAGPPPNEPDAPPGVSSSHLHDRIESSDILDVKAPAGDFHLDLASSRPVVLIGGGVGVTPVLAMLNSLAQRGFDREVWFFYGVRGPEEHIMREHLDELAQRCPQKLHLHVCYSDTEAGELPDEGAVRYHTEFVSVGLFQRVLPSNNYDYYICGPPPMMDSLTHGLRDSGVPSDCIHFESFGPASVKRTPQAEDASAHADSGIVVRFARSNLDLHWNPEVGSLLEFAEANGVHINSGCRAGRCDSCLTAIKSGEVEYLTAPGTPPESGSCLTCISIPKTNVTLDA